MASSPASSHNARVFPSVILEREDQPLLFSSGSFRAIGCVQVGSKPETSEVVPKIGAANAHASAEGAR